MTNTNHVLAVEQGLLPLVQAGGTIGWILLALAVIALALTFLHLWTIRRARLLPRELVARIAAAIKQGDLQQAAAICRTHGGDSLPSHITAAVLHRLQYSPLGGLEVPDVAQEAGAAQLARLERPLEGLSVIAAVAPLLGLLGTVLGMVDAFDVIAGQGPQAAGELAASISLALVTTLLGLSVAIPCVALHAWFRVRLERIADEAGDVMESVLAPLLSEEGSGSTSSSGQPPKATPQEQV